MLKLIELVGNIKLKGPVISREYNLTRRSYSDDCDCESGSDCSECGGGDCSDCDCTSDNCDDC